MSSENEKTTLAALAEGGLPQILAGPAGKAFSRLIGSVVDIPIAWMERISQGVRDDTAVISNFKEEVGDEVTAMALDDPNFMKRAKDCCITPHLNVAAYVSSCWKMFSFRNSPDGT